MFHSQPPAADSLYWQAVENLDVSNKSGTLDTAIAKLDAYLASPGKLPHAKEAQVLRSLARNAQQLARVEATLQQARANAAENRPRETSDSKARDDESLKEIQRLKDELAAANAELERIKKRLAAPPTKP
jgi:capsule polysaccharide export protein KpsE/RkpR